MAKGFMVYDFMTEDLGLKGISLTVYALIFSFSKDGIGKCKASRKYIAKQVGSSVSSVTRATADLIEKGLIKELGSTEVSQTKIYIADLSKLNKKLDSFYLTRFSDTDENGDAPEAKCEEAATKMQPNKKEDNETINTSSSSNACTRSKYGNGLPFSEDIMSATEQMEIYYCRHLTRKKVKYNLLSFGKDGGVSLTKDQYIALRELVEYDTLYSYFRRLEAYIDRLPKEEKGIFSHYRTLLRWIKEDLTTDGE